MTIKKRKPGRPPQHTSGAMTILRLRVPKPMLDWIDSKGNRSKVVRDIIEQAKRQDEAEEGEFDEAMKDEN